MTVCAKFLQRQPQFKKLVHKVSEARSRAIEGNEESEENDLDCLSLISGEVTLEAEKHYVQAALYALQDFEGLVKQFSKVL